MLWMSAAPAVSALVFAAGLWAPPSSSSGGATPAGIVTPGPRRARKRPATPPGERAAPTARKGSTEALEAEVFGEETAPQVRRSAPTTPASGSAARRQSNDEDGDSEEVDDDEDRRGRTPAVTLAPVIAPHLIAFGLGTSLMGRSFSYDAPLQPESSFGRGGVVAALEAYPLVSARGWYARLGLGASFGTELGNATASAQADGGTLSYKVSERRWELDVRYALPLHARFLLVPRLGYGQSSYDLDRHPQPSPSTCTSATTMTQVCLPDVGVSHLAIGVDARFAATSRLGLSLGAAFLPAFGVARGMGQLGAEAAPSAIGFSTEIAANFQLLDWLALRAAVPVVRYSYSFSAPALSYKAASEMYYGVTVGAVVFAR